MYIHFEDWTAPIFLRTLDAKGLPHAGRIIKAYTTYQDPRKFIDKPNLVVLEMDHSPFRKDEEFNYDERESYTGTDFETRLSDLGLREVGKDVTRTLMRFANQKGAEFCQTAMAAKVNGRWLFDHPFQDLHGFEQAALYPAARESKIHLDIFYPPSIDRIRNFVDIDNPEQILPMMEHQLLEGAMHPN